MSNTEKSHDVSIRGPLYQLVREHCRKKGVVMSHEVTRWVDDHFDVLERPEPEPEPEPLPDLVLEPRSKDDVDVEAEAKDHFTW